MRAEDFEYDGQCLSDYGFIVCDFSYSNGVAESTQGSTITFNTVTRNRGKKNSLTGTQYDECIKTSFDICKNPDLFEYDDRKISKDEYLDMMRWLNRESFHKFHPLPLVDEGLGNETYYFNASFNITKLKIGEVLYGLRLSMETDSPFAYGEEIVKELIFTKTHTEEITKPDGTNQTVYFQVMEDESSDTGEIHPKVKIKLGRSVGELTIKNDFTNSETVIKNCVAGETIILDGNTLIISTDSSHDVCNDFNYEFLSIGNSFSSRENKITVSLPCTMTISYVPIIKDVP